MSNESLENFKPTGPLRQQLWAVDNFIEQQRQDRVAEAKKTYAMVMARWPQPEPGDAVLLHLAAEVIWPLLDRLESERPGIRSRTIERDLEKAAELDRKDRLFQERQDHIDGLQRAADKLKAEYDQLVQATAGDKTPEAKDRRHQASKDHFWAQEPIEELRRKLGREMEEHRLDKSVHRRLYGQLW